MGDKRNIINPEDQSYYDDKLYKVGIWPGAGYQLNTYYVYANSEETALDLVVVYLEIYNPSLLSSVQEVEDRINEDYQTEFNNFIVKGEDNDIITFANDYLNLLYIDATMNGATQPYFIESENLVVEEVNKDTELQENTDIKKYVSEKAENDPVWKIAETHWTEESLEKLDKANREEQFKMVFDYINEVSYDFCTDELKDNTISNKEKNMLIDNSIKELNSLKIPEFKDKFDLIDDSVKKFNNLKVEETKTEKVQEDVSDNETQIANWIKDTVEDLKEDEAGCGTWKLDDRLAICVGWSDGYDKNDIDDNYIHSKEDPTYCINAAIKVWTSDDMRTDLDWISYPYDDENVYDDSYTISKN